MLNNDMTNLIINNMSFGDVKVAITWNEHQHGLMYQKWPPPIMIFPYKKATIRRFWMKNTPSPLDIIFCKNKNIVGIYKGEPFSLSGVGPNEPSDLVIEMPAGTVEKFNIKIGDNIDIKYSDETLVKILKNGLI